MIIGAPERVEAYGTRTKGYQLIWHDSAGKLQSIPKLLAKFRQQRVNVKVSNGGWEPLIDREVFVYEGWGHWLFPTDGAVLRDRETWLDEEIKKLIPAGSEMQIEVTVVPNNCLTIHGHVQFRSEGVMVRVYGQTLWTSLRKLLTPFPAGMYVREREFLDAERMRPLENEHPYIPVRTILIDNREPLFDESRMCSFDSGEFYIGHRCHRNTISADFWEYKISNRRAMRTIVLDFEGGEALVKAYDPSVSYPVK